MTAVVHEIERVLGMTSTSALQAFLDHYVSGNPDQRAHALITCASREPEWFTACAVRNAVDAHPPDLNVLATTMTDGMRDTDVAHMLHILLAGSAATLSFDAVQSLVHLNSQEIQFIVGESLCARVGRSCTDATPWCQLAAAYVTRMRVFSVADAKTLVQFAAQAMACKHAGAVSAVDMVKGRELWIARADYCPHALFEQIFPNKPWLSDTVLACVDKIPIADWILRLSGYSTVVGGVRMDDRYLFLQNLGVHLALDPGHPLVENKRQSAWVIVAFACAGKLAQAPWAVRAPICVDTLPVDMSFLPFEVLQRIVDHVDLLPRPVVESYAAVVPLVTRS